MRTNEDGQWQVVYRVVSAQRSVTLECAGGLRRGRLSLLPSSASQLRPFTHRFPDPLIGWGVYMVSARGRMDGGPGRDDLIPPSLPLPQGCHPVCRCVSRSQVPSSHEKAPRSIYPACWGVSARPLSVAHPSRARAGGVRGSSPGRAGTSRKRDKKESTGKESCSPASSPQHRWQFPLIFSRRHLIFLFFRLTAFLWNCPKHVRQRFLMASCVSRVWARASCPRKWKPFFQ